MKILAIDTAGVDCSAAVYDAPSGRCVVVTERIGKGHAECLMAMIDDALVQSHCSLQDLNRIAVTVGPGSFTGIRVGVAAARGLALALKVDVVGVSTLHVLARTFLDQDATRPVIAAMDAKRSEIYAQPFDTQMRPLLPPAAISLGELREWQVHHGAAVTGSACALLENAAPDGEPDRFDVSVVARLGAGAVPGVDLAKPLYLRGPDAKPQDGFALARA